MKLQLTLIYRNRCVGWHFSSLYLVNLLQELQMLVFAITDKGTLLQTLV